MNKWHDTEKSRVQTTSKGCEPERKRKQTRNYLQWTPTCCSDQENVNTRLRLHTPQNSPLSPVLKGTDKIVHHGNILGTDIPAWSLPRDDQSFWHLAMTSSVLIFAQKQFNGYLGSTGVNLRFACWHFGITTKRI